MDNLSNTVDIDFLEDDKLFKLLDSIINRDNDSIRKEIYNYCDVCESDNHIVTDTSNGFLVCTKCGSIVQNIIDESPEWNNYNNGSSRQINRCSAPTNKLLPRSSLGTTIASNSRSCRIKRIHGWIAMPYNERSLYNVLKDLNDKCRRGKILKCVIDDAKILYKRISEHKHSCGKNKGKKIIIRGKNRKSLIAACVFYACKKQNRTRSQKEIAKIFGLRYTDITRGCKTFMKLLRNRHMEYNINYSIPSHYINRHCLKLHISKKYIDEALRITINIQKLNIVTEHTPLSVASGSILLIANMNNLALSKKKIADEFEVSEVTISKVYKKLDKHKDILIDDEITNKILKLMQAQQALSRTN